MYNSPVFYVLTIITLRKHQKKIKNHYSFTKSVDLKWLNYLSHGFAVFLFFLLFQGVIENILKMEFPFGNYDYSILVNVIYIFGIGYFGYKQRGIFNNYSHSTTEPVAEEIIQKIKTNQIESKKHYQKSGLNEEEAHEILSKLYSLMDSDQPYLESELDLPALAEMVYVSSHKLSQVINEYLNKNFFDFVNEYRINKVKEYLTDPDSNQYKIISLAYDSGFNSKSTFYNFFKKVEGVTPAEYRQKYQKEAV
jgi:AraC-like DNA-binding protein